MEHSWKVATIAHALALIKNHYFDGNVDANFIVIKMADTLSAYLKCRYEINNGNKEFAIAIQEITKKLENFQAPEIAYFMDVFVSSYDLTLDDLLSEKY